MCYGDKRSVKNGIHFHVSQKKVFPVGRDFYFYTLPCRAYDIVYLFFKEVLNLTVEEAEQEAEKIKSAISDNAINRLAKYVHKVLDLGNLDCDYDINKERCRNCGRRTTFK